MLIEYIFRVSLSNKKSKGSTHVLLGKRIGKIWTCSGWEKGNFIMINEFKYGRTWKIWPSPLSLSLNSTFNTYSKTFLSKKSFLKCRFFILEINTLLQTNFYVVSKFAKHLQHCSDTDRPLKQIWSIWIFLNWYFNQDNSLI